MCQFDRQSLANTVQAQAGSLSTHISTGFSPNPSNLYDDGTIIGLSGANSGLKRSIGAIVDGVVYLRVPLIWPPAIGDYFSVLPGCDHTITSCQNIFNNLIHFGGQPYVPQPEFSV
jgi:hypothetical protein